MANLTDQKHMKGALRECIESSPKYQSDAMKASWYMHQ